jgi:uracil-DNA glycosylase
MPAFDDIFNAIKNDPQNADYTARGIDPLYAASPTARILVIGQAPGRVAEEKRRYWDDKSGDRLRDWMGIDRATFYDPSRIAIMPMDFYFPGKGKSGDLPPRPGFAEKWHPALLELMPDIDLTILVGTYAVHRYLGLKQSVPLTGIVHDWKSYLPRGYLPLVHPSPRNQIWMKKNPWFAEETLPDLQQAVADALK